MNRIYIKSFYLLAFSLLISTVTFAQWTALSGPPGGNVADIEYSTSSSKVFVVINQKLYSSTNDGTSWQQVIPTTPASFYLNDFMIDGANLYALYYSNLYKSVDGGVNWVKTNANGQYLNGEHVTKIGTNTLAVNGYSGLFISYDDGVNWTQISTGNVYGVVAITAGDVFFTDNVGIRKLAVANKPWTAASATTVKSITPAQSYYPQYYRLSYDAVGNRMYAGVYDDLLRSTDGTGATWASVKAATGESTFYNSGQVVSVSPTGNLYLNTNQKTYYSAVGVTSGTTWSLMTNYASAAYSNSSVSNLAFASGTKAFAGTAGDGIFLSTAVNTTTATWSFVTNGIYSANGTSIKVSGSRLLYANGGMGLWNSTNGGTTWNYNNSGITSSINKLLEMPNGNLVAYGGPIYTSTAANGGASWTATSTSNYAYYMVCTPATSATPNVLFGASAGTFGRSDDSGITWYNFSSISGTGFPASYYVYNLTVDTSSGIVLIAQIYNNTTSKNEFWKITVGGTSTSPTGTAVKITDPLGFNSDNGVSGFFTSGSKLYLAQPQQIFISPDQGLTWNTVSFSNSAVLPIAGGICVSNYGSLYISKDDGLNWSNASLPSSDGYITDIDTDGTNFYASAYNMPALKFTGNPVPATTPTYINFNWQPTSGPYGGYIHSLTTDAANNIYALGDYGTVFKTTSTFTTWQNIVPSGRYFTGITASAGTLYATDGNDAHLYTSSNAGATWTLKNNEYIYAYSVKVVNGNIFLFAYDRLYVSTDGGTTFGAAKYVYPTGQTYYSTYTIAVSSSNIVYVTLWDNASTSYKVIKLNSTGVVQAGSPLTMPNTVGIYADNTGNLYTNTGSDVYKSIDAGVTWTSIKGDYTNNSINTLSVISSSEIYLLNYNSRIYKSVNNGANWTLFGTPSATPNALILSGSNIVTGTSNGIQLSTDGGATFIDKNTGLTGVSLSSLKLTSPSSIFAVGNSTNLNFVTTNGGTAWTKYSANPFRGRLISMANGDFIAFTSFEIYKSTDSGQTWTKISTVSNFNFANITTTDGTFYFAYSPNNDIYYSNDLITWTKLAISGLPASFNINNIATDPTGLLYITIYNYSSSTPEAYQVQYGTAIKINGPRNPSSVEFYNNKILLYDQDGAIYETSDGATFNRKSTPGGDKLIIAAKGYYFIPQYGGSLWLSRDQGTSWQNVGLGANYNGSFADVIVNEYDGYAYGVVNGSAVRKSASVVIPSETTAPLAVAFDPLNNATNVSVKPGLSITFDEPVKTITTKTVKILDVANPINPVETIDAALGVQNGKKFTFTPTTVLSYSKTYFVVVDNGAFEDLFTNKYAGFSNNTTWRFTTKAAPTISTLAPVTSASTVPLNTKLDITFSEPMTGTSSKNINIYNSAQPSSPVITIAASSGVVSGNKLSYTLPNALQYATSYYVIADANAFTSAEGATISLLTTNTSWTFTTVAPPDTQAPVITFTPSNIDKGSVKKIDPSISDNTAVTSATLSYRGTLSTSNFIDVAMTYNSSNLKWETTVDETWLDKIGLEYYITSKDAANNAARSPAIATDFHHAYINYPATSSSSTLTVSGLSFGGKETDYRIFSIPYKLTSNSIASIFDELGAPDVSKYRILTYSGFNTWLSYPTDLTTITPGVGYWINMKLQTPITLSAGASTPEITKSSPVNLTLKPGWNQIGNPYPFEISWEAVRTVSSNIGVIKKYNGVYTNGDKLGVFEGGFVFLNGAVNVSFSLPLSSATGGRISETQQDPFASEGWLLPIQLKSGDVENTFGGVGMHPQANESFDQFDDIPLPHFLNFADITFDHPEHSAKKFARDILPITEDHVWSFTVESSSQESVLTWDNRWINKLSKDVFLFDENLQIIVNMKTESDYHFISPGPSRFKIYYGDGALSKISPTKVLLGKTYPNPSNGTATIPFTLPDTYGNFSISLEVLDLAGRNVRTLAKGAYAPGFYPVELNSEVDAIKPGLYVIKLTVISGSHKEVQNQKIVIQK